MVTPILLVTSDLAQCNEIIRMARNMPFEVELCGSAEEAARILPASGEGLIAIFDLDRMDLDERYFRQLPKAPGRCMMGISSSPFHPDLKEAIGQHLTACLRKPIDPEELLFLLDSFAKNGCTRGR
jgi:hypothetical protein